MANEITTAPVTINDAQTNILTQKTPTDAIRHREGPSGKTLAYVKHAWVTEQLNEAFNWAWSWEITEYRLLPETEPTEVFVLGRLTIHTPNGDLVKSQFGSADIKRRKNGTVISIGDDLKAASSDALKKAASLLGLALDLYRSEDNGNGASQPGAGHNGTARPAANAMTAFWQAINARGLSRDDGRAILASADGDATRALARLNELHTATN